MKPRFASFLCSIAAFAGLGWFTTIGPAQGADPRPEAPSGNVTISFWAIATQPFQIMIDDFQKTYPNIKVKWTKYSTDEIKQALRVASAAGKMPDVWFNWGGSLAAPYEDGGHALELTPELMAAYGIDQNILPVALDLARHKGKLYGVPFWVRPMTIFYKKSIFDKHGLSAPKTFAELEQACATLKSKGVTPIACGGKFSWMTMRTTDYFIEHYAGPALHDKLFALEESWNSPPVIQAFAKLKEWVGKGYFNEGFISLDPNQALPLLFQDNAAMIFQGPWIEDQNIIKGGQDPNNYVPIVAPSDHAPARVSGFQEQLQFSSKSKPDARKAAILFASFITSPEIAKQKVKDFGSPSAVKGVFPPEDRPIGTQMTKWLQGEVKLYLPTDQAVPQEIVNAFFQAQDSVVLGSMTPENAAAQVQKAVEAYKSAQN